MKKLITLLVSYLFCQALWGQRITISFYEPYPYYGEMPIADSVMRVDAQIGSTYPLASVTARVEDRQIPLTTQFMARGHYIGDLTLLGLPQLKFLYVYVTAVDTAGNQAVDSQQFIYVHSPWLTIDSPLSWSVARPMLSIKARSSDTLQLSTLSYQWNRGDEHYFMTDSVDTLIDLSPYEGTMGILTIVATDFDVKKRYSLSVPIYVDSSTRLTQIFAARDLIDDFNYHRVFVTNPWRGPVDNTPDRNPFQYRSRLVDVLSGDSIPLAEQRGLLTGNGANRITPFGVLYTTRDTVGTPLTLYDMNRGAVTNLGTLYSSQSLRQAGNYALWSNGDTLHFRDLRGPTDDTVSTTAGNDHNELAANGVAAYWNKDYSIHRWEGGVDTEVIPHNDAYSNFGPSTDGHLILYSRNNSGVFTIHLTDGVTDTVLSDMGTTTPHGKGEQVNNGFVAFTKYDGGNILQVWLRDTLGVSRQMTNFTTDSWVDRLGPNGDMIIVNKPAGSVSKRFFVERASGQVTELCSSVGTVYNRGGGWYLSMGRMLYRLDAGAQLSAPGEPVLTALRDSLCRLAGVQRVKLLNLPDTSGVVAVAAALDGVVILPAADSSLSFDVSTLAVGDHVLAVDYINPLGSSHVVDSFVVLAIDSPEVQLSSNISEVVNLTDPVVLTATAHAGGGAAPRYTFATDRAFTHVLQGEGVASVLSLAPSTLAVGMNWFYVRMRTSDSCYAWASDVDSVQAERSPVTGIIDPEFPDQVISIAPNPFVRSLRIDGLHQGKRYRLAMRNSLGQTVLQGELRDAPVATVTTGVLPAGVYWVTLYDGKSGRAIGTMVVVRG